ncbi:zinc metalloprotease HtpX [Candidatus Gottesmanbacteria bacterium RIFCSPHIGHO2_02_FULL_40_13]|uniref:Protease HtpX homolog n=1 Tax=Candidatus Gottesmanbacteria bacterium RIFCSPHIGHO2_02_FULL_40_13 TaxID=1798384 RepID=A0A1F6AAP2_9BACT|nr:MAG: zinc metalloprotease HtpX [Candidatus Gottesmanbacteria bacterium RIFCSPHIGHO2_02_FULL_40_13]
MVVSIYSQIDANRKKTYFIMVFFILFIIFISYVFGKALGYGGSLVGIAFIVSGIMTWSSYYFGDKIILGLSGAREADRKRDFDFYTISENIAIGAGIPKPKLYVIEDSAPNAFATGRDPQHAVVCATRGLLQKLDRYELEGVIAHEMSHIQNYDTRWMAVVSILVGTVAFLSDWFMRSLWWGGGRRRDDRGGSGILIILGIVFAILTPIIATLIQFAVSRKREFLADASGTLITRNPKALAMALEKISQDKEVLEAATNATAHLYIINPFKDKNFTAWFSSLFNTHPPIEERIKILRSM